MMNLEVSKTTKSIHPSIKTKTKMMMMMMILFYLIYFFYPPSKLRDLVREKERKEKKKNHKGLKSILIENLIDGWDGMDQQRWLGP